MTVKNDFPIRSNFATWRFSENAPPEGRKIVLNRHFVLRGSPPLRQTGIDTRPCSLITESSPRPDASESPPRPAGRASCPTRRAKPRPAGGAFRSARSGEARLEGRRTRTRIGPGLAKRNGFTPHYLTLMADSDDCSPSSQSGQTLRGTIATPCERALPATGRDRPRNGSVRAVALRLGAWSDADHGVQEDIRRSDGPHRRGRAHHATVRQMARRTRVRDRPRPRRRPASLAARRRHRHPLSRLHRGPREAPVLRGSSLVRGGNGCRRRKPAFLKSLSTWDVTYPSPGIATTKPENGPAHGILSLRHPNRQKACKEKDV